MALSKDLIFDSSGRWLSGIYRGFPLDPLHLGYHECENCNPDDYSILSTGPGRTMRLKRHGMQKLHRRFKKGRK